MFATRDIRALILLSLIFSARAKPPGAGNESILCRWTLGPFFDSAGAKPSRQETRRCRIAPKSPLVGDFDQPVLAKEGLLQPRSFLKICSSSASSVNWKIRPKNEIRSCLIVASVGFISACKKSLTES
jgi:hypothetical protein